jgi:hypothetical protein
MSNIAYPVKHLSNSAIKQYISCPFAFKAKYVLKMKQPSNEHFAFGKAVHSAAEYQIRFNLKRNKNLPLHVVLEMYQKTAQEEATKLNKYAIDAFRKMYPYGHDLVEQYYFYLCKRKPVAVEQYFKLDMGFDLPILGYIDVIFEDDALRDVKTASKPWTRGKLDGELQFTIYNEAYNILYGKYPKTIGTIELDKTIIQTDKSQNAIREQLTHRNSNSREKMNLVINTVIDGMQKEKYPRCGKRSCWACSTL